MAVYKVTFTPSGPYFFGNEKSFAYPGQKNGGAWGNLYFIRGEAMPSQTTLLGALRYCLLPLKGYQNLKAEENKHAVGESSFHIDSTTVQDFGKIKALSPVFLVRGEEIFVATPFDHNCHAPRTNEEAPKLCFYTPFQKYEPLTTPEGEKLYTAEYRAKEGITSSFMSLNDLHLEDGLFRSDVRVGIRRVPKKDGFFKKEYRVLQKGFSFAVLAEIEDETLNGFSETVTLGQGKVPFAVHFAFCADAKGIGVGYLAQKVQTALKPLKNRCENTYYCLGSLFLDTVNFEQYYRDNLQFAIVKTREFRNFRTQVGGRIEKSTELFRLLEPGSIMIGENEPPVTETIHQENARQIGWNHIIRIGGKENA